MSASAQPSIRVSDIPAAGTPPSDHPSTLLLEVVVALLTPMFLGCSRGDPTLARAAALETIASYQAASQADLISVLQIIALGLASVQAACLSMSPDLPAEDAMRLFGYADRLNRSGMARDKLRRQERAAGSPPVKPAAPARAAGPQVKPAPPASPPATRPKPARPAAKVPPVGAPPLGADLAHMIKVMARELGFDPARSPVQAETEMKLRAKALSSVAQDLLDGIDLPLAQFRLPPEVGIPAK